jgi:predicted MFS family arabinose efflux permease
MMFLQFGVYGLWLPIAGRFLTASRASGGLGFTESQSGTIVGFAAAIGAIGAPFIVQFADRRFAAQKFLGLLMIVGGVLKIITYYQTSLTAWLLLSIAFTLLFMPCAAICNAIPMRHLANPQREWPGVRMWSAIAWVFVGWTFSFFVLTRNPAPHPLPPFFKGEQVPMAGAAMLTSVLWSGILAIIYGALAYLFGPPTPPVTDRPDARKNVLAKAVALLKVRSFAIMLSVTLVMSAVHVIYFMQCAKFLSAAGLHDAYIMPAMAIGQLCEIGMYLVLGRLLPRFGFRTIIATGISFFVIRFLVLGTVGFPLWVMVAAQVFHGLCYAFFFGACFIYTDKVAPPEIRNSAQSVYNFVFYGLGPITAVFLNAFLANRYAAAGRILELQGFSHFWYSLAALAFVSLIVFLVCFRPETTPKTSSGLPELKYSNAK